MALGALTSVSPHSFGLSSEQTAKDCGTARQIVSARSPIEELLASVSGVDCEIQTVLEQMQLVEKREQDLKDGISYRDEARDQGLEKTAGSYQDVLDTVKNFGN